MSQAVALPDAPVAAEDLAHGALASRAMTLARPSVIGLPSRDEWIMLTALANTFANSDLLPEGLKGKPQNVLAVILKGRDLGMTPTQAVWGIHMIEGMPSLAAHTMMALIRKVGHRIDYAETNVNSATIVAERYEGRNPVTGEREFGPEVRVSWTIDQAIQAGLLKPGTGADQGKLIARSRTGKVLPWELYTEAMLRARAASAMARMSFSDVLLGSWYTPDELDCEVDAQGNPTRYPSGDEAQAAFDRQIEARKAEVAGQPMTVQSARPPADAVAEGEALAGEPAPTVVDVQAVPQTLDRVELLMELDEQARVLADGAVARYTTRAVAAYKANAKDWSAEQLEEFLAPRREAYAAHMSQHPEDASPVEDDTPETEAEETQSDETADEAVVVEDLPKGFGEPTETNDLGPTETKEHGDTPPVVRSRWIPSP